MPILKDMASISDLAKFFIMLLLYTGYMTWWAASVSHDIEQNQSNIYTHINSKEHPFYQTTAIKNITKIQDTHAAILLTLTEDHAKCRILLENMQEDIRNLKDFR